MILGGNMEDKLKAKAVKNRLNKYNVIVNYEGKLMPVGITLTGDDIAKYKADYKLLEWDKKGEAVDYILSNNDRLELVEN